MSDNDRSRALSSLIGPERLISLTLSLLAAALVLAFSRFGLGATGDSIHYFMGAENLLAGEGFGRTTASGEIQAITILPPGYSLVLGSLGFFGLDIFDGARILHALLFGASVFLVCTMIVRSTHSIVAAGLGGGLVALAMREVQYNGWLMPEAPYIFLMLSTLALLMITLESGNRRHLLLTGVLTAVASLTRYIGLSLIITGVLSLLLLNQGDWRKRLGDAVLFLTISFTPLILWLRRNAAEAGTLVNREFGFHLVDVELIRAYRAEISYWFVPARLGLPHAIRRAIMTLFALAGPATFYAFAASDFFKKRLDRDKPFWTLPWVLGIYAVAYGATLFINLTILDAVIDFNVIPRYLTPIFVIVVILLVIVYHNLVVQRLTQVLPRIALLAVGVSLLTLYALDTVEMLREPIPSLGYTGLMLERGEMLERLDEIDREAPIISNDPELVFFFSDRPAYMMPIRFDFNTLQERDDFEQQVAATRRKLDDGGMLVLFDPLREAELEVLNLLEPTLMNAYYGSSFYAYPEALGD